MIKIISLMLAASMVFSAGTYSSVPAVMTQTTAVQTDITAAKVSYLGPEGTYTQEACRVFFGNESTLIPCTTVNDAVDELVRCRTSYAVIPQENTIGGAVTDYIDTLIAYRKVYVVGEIELPIDQDLLTVPGAELGDIKTVYSHKQGIAQGKEWLEKNIPDAEIIEVSSTAEGAKMVSEGKDSSKAAIASAACAEVYGLEVKAAAIQNNDKNKTRFYVLSAERPSVKKSDRMAFIIKGKAEYLPALMADMESKGMKLVTIHDRPLKTELGEYWYVIECSDSTYKQYKELKQNSSFRFRYLGSFPVY